MPDTTSDHDLLLRLDERMSHLQRLVAALLEKLVQAQSAIVTLRIDAAKIAAVMGLLSGLVASLGAMLIWAHFWAK